MNIAVQQSVLTTSSYTHSLCCDRGSSELLPQPNPLAHLQPLHQLAEAAANTSVHAHQQNNSAHFQLTPPVLLTNQTAAVNNSLPHQQHTILANGASSSFQNASINPAQHPHPAAAGSAQQAAPRPSLIDSLVSCDYSLCSFMIKAERMVLRLST